MYFYSKIKLVSTEYASSWFLTIGDPYTRTMSLKTTPSEAKENAETPSIHAVAVKLSPFCPQEATSSFAWEESQTPERRQTMCWRQSPSSYSLVLPHGWTTRTRTKTSNMKTWRVTFYKSSLSPSAPVPKSSWVFPIYLWETQQHMQHGTRCRLSLHSLTSTLPPTNHGVWTWCGSCGCSAFPPL